MFPYKRFISVIKTLQACRQVNRTLVKGGYQNYFHISQSNYLITDG